MTQPNLALNPQDIDLLNRVIATVIKQVDDFAYLDNHPRAPNFDSRELCRLRMKIAPHIGISETIETLKETT